MTDETYDLRRKLAAEAIGSAFLVATIVGSGIMGEMLSGGNVGVAMLGHTLAIGFMLIVLILTFGQISGAHFNPAVTLSFLVQGHIGVRDALAYIATQITAAILGAWLAHLMFDVPVFMQSETVRSGGGQWVAEIVATFGLVAAIIACIRHRADAVPYAVGLYIFAAQWFTASTSFANPAVTIARTLSDTFSGIRPADAPLFVICQIVGALLATWTFAWLFRTRS